jgi:hypothetical protein
MHTRRGGAPKERGAEERAAHAGVAPPPFLTKT